MVGTFRLQKQVHDDWGLIFGASFVRNFSAAVPVSASHMILAFQGMVAGWDQIPDPGLPSDTRTFVPYGECRPGQRRLSGFLLKGKEERECGYVAVPLVRPAMGLIAGKDLTRHGTHLDTFLFNLPIVIVLSYLRMGVLDFQFGTPCQNEEHAVAACFINGVYVLEHERRQGRSDDNHALARPWWDSFGYTLLQALVDPDEGVIFGAIYVRNPRVAAPESAPQMVMAFRGMVTSWDQISDPNTPSSSHIFSDMLKVALENIGSLGYYSKHGRAWLCGHSLGAAMGLIAGKFLARSGTYLDTFLFNPPIVLHYLRKGQIDFYTESLWDDPIGLIAWNMFVLAHKEYMSKEGKKGFENLVKWQPRLLVNPGDFICNGYIDYYGERDSTKEGCQLELSLPFVNPSACLVLNVGSSEECHGIKQWWDRNLNVERRPYVCVSD
ncbi:GDSL esterase/lipase [Nymphaea thermarum]|nr:GDSL esterase/lipase [Nymphaea thermarum]